MEANPSIVVAYEQNVTNGKIVISLVNIDFSKTIPIFSLIRISLYKCFDNHPGKFSIWNFDIPFSLVRIYIEMINAIKEGEKPISYEHGGIKDESIRNNGEFFSIYWNSANYPTILNENLYSRVVSFHVTKEELFVIGELLEKLYN